MTANPNVGNDRGSSGRYESTSEDYVSPLGLCAFLGWLPGVEILLQHPRIDGHCGAGHKHSSEVQDREENETPLYTAAANGHADVVRRLLSVPGIDKTRGKVEWSRSDYYQVGETESVTSPEKAAAKFPDVIAAFKDFPSSH